ncbi:FMN-dependent oxidoreductase (nitrilotriacetate monooxygenase family) [Amycolatopsis sulphurea]|uniref:FMN-dependent oxidoreductase (Nitrilotriacetate monooxygenase family) n=1 Tax=Amycolatopsis sulphurea TaxID=76022 RepID=A0A2A9FGL6_9PSEU|nr:NtaA/DmoA family FMN-dependent monooxygenase [Amycolatopsis sulphurea]PFG49650.1 FMN-dependent oxidoreductase (nitrilotriacetate monooxygenase family) [Amycolatopsis sulphurea]
MSRQLHLLLLGNPRFGSTWRYPGVENGPAATLRSVIDAAKTAERGTFDAIFFADTLNYGPDAAWPHKSTEDFEPFTTTAALTRETERLGLVVTGSATFQAPYHLARQLISLDHLSGGRAGWNVVTSFAQAAAANFGGAGVLAHDERYRVAGEALDVVRKLWRSWGPDTVVEDRVAGVYNDPARIRVPAHEGEFFQVRGPLGASPSAQGHPVIFQAGSSVAGRAFAARNAEVVFTGQGDFERGRVFVSQIHDEARSFGRVAAPLVTPSLGFVIGATDAEARQVEETIFEHFIPEHQIGWLQEVDIDLTGADLDAPVPLAAFAESTQTHQTALAGYRALATQGNPTLREFLFRTVTAFGARVVGSPERIADEIERWFTGRAADGFILGPSGIPGQLETFVDHVVPILRRRGLFRHEYAGRTLRSHLGLPESFPLGEKSQRKPSVALH